MLKMFEKLGSQVQEIFNSPKPQEAMTSKLELTPEQAYVLEVALTQYANKTYKEMRESSLQGCGGRAERYETLYGVARDILFNLSATGAPKKSPV